MAETLRLKDWKPLPAERKLAESVGTGQTVVIGDGTLPPEDPPEDRVIRTGFLRALILGRIAGHMPHEKGVQMRGAYLRGDNPEGDETAGLDLEGCDLPGDLLLAYCRIPDLLLLRSASLRNLFLNASHLGSGLGGDRLRATGDVFLRGEGTPGSAAHRPFVAEGEVRLLGAKLGGDLSCTGARLTAGETGRALNADGLDVTGSVFLLGLEAEGAVRLLGAKLGGDLDCEGARLTAAKSPQTGERGKALNLQGARVTGALFLRDGATVSGVLDLTEAEIGAIVDDPACWPNSGDLLLDRCRYGSFVGGAKVEGQARIDWLLRQPERYLGVEFRPQPWEECARVLRSMGHEADARAVLIEKEKRQRRARRDRLRREHLYEDAAWFSFWDALMGITTRYGRQPLLAFAWLAGLILLGLGVFEGARNAEALKPNDSIALRSAEWVDCVPGAERYSGEGSQLACFLEQPEGRGYPAFNPLVYSADALLPIFDLGMQEYWVADENTGFGQGARVYLWVHITLGWALSLLAVAGFSGLIRTDNTT